MPRDFTSKPKYVQFNFSGPTSRCMLGAVGLIALTKFLFIFKHI